MSPHAGGLLADAVFLFDAAGRRCGGSRGVDAAFGGEPVRDIRDLGTRFRQLDGTPLQLDLPGSRTAVGSNGSGGGAVAITTELIDGATNDSCSPALLVSVHPYRTDDDPATLQRVLGSVLGHELRTPMTTIYGGAQLVTHAGVSPATRDEAAKAIEREARRLHRIVEDLVVLVRPVGDASAEPEPLMLQHVLPHVVEAERAARPEATIELTIAPALPAVLGSADDVEHVVRNLVAHALIYSPDDGRIVVEASRVDDAVEVRVADDGPARDEGDARGAFDLFHASSRTAADTSGANLALVATRRLVERMSGRIWARTIPTGGEVAFSLPIAPLDD